MPKPILMIGSTLCPIIVLSPRWVWFDLRLSALIVPNQRGFFNLFPGKILANRGIRERELG